MYGSLDILRDGFRVLYGSSLFFPACDYPISLKHEHYAFHIFLYASCSTHRYHSSCTEPCRRVLDRLPWQAKASYYLLICDTTHTSTASCNVQSLQLLTPRPTTTRSHNTPGCPRSPSSSPSSPDSHNQRSLLLGLKRRITRREGKEDNTAVNAAPTRHYVERRRRVCKFVCSSSILST